MAAKLSKGIPKMFFEECESYEAQNEKTRCRFYVSASGIAFILPDCCISLGIGFKVVHDGAVLPAAFFRKDIGQIVVEQGDIWLDALFQAVVDHIVVELNALGVHLTPAVGPE